MASARGRDWNPSGDRESVAWLDLRAQYLSIQGEIDEAIQRVLLSGQYILTDEVSRLEEEFARYCGVTHAVAVHSGSDAIVLALKALGVGAGDEVLLPANSCLSEPNAILLAGATPVPVDIEERTYNVDSAALADCIGPRTKAIHAVHAYGHPCDMAAINALAREHDLVVMEDIALGPGTLIDGTRVGSFGDIAVASFGQGKILNAYGNGGGIVLTNSARVEKRVRRLANYGQGILPPETLSNGFVPLGGTAWIEPGYNSMLDSIQAAVLRVKLRHLDAWLERRAELAARYDEALRSLDVVTPKIRANVTSAFRGYLVRVAQRDRVLAYLHEHGVGAATLYLPPVHLQPAMATYGYREGDFPVTERVAREMISLPIYPEMTNEQQDCVIQTLRNGLKDLMETEKRSNSC